MLEATLAPSPQPQQLWRDTMAEMARVSCAAYRQVVREDARFVEFFQTLTPGQIMQSFLVFPWAWVGCADRAFALAVSG